MSDLFKPLKIRELSLKNRIFVSPMCQYSAVEGVPNDWHLVHLGSRAVGGASLVISEATAVSPQGRISPGDTGLWNDEQEKAFSRITTFIAAQSSVPGIQLAHAGRKASTSTPWLGGQPLEGPQAWQTIAPSNLPFSEQHPVPKEMSVVDIESVVEQFAIATARSLRAGFKVVEIHMAHGYLLHEFLSPLSNQRQDAYGGSLEHRMRFPLLVAEKVRKLWPDTLPVFVRISATDWLEHGGWTLADSIEFCKRLKDIGIDFIDCSSGGNIPGANIPAGPGYQVQFAEAIRREAHILTGAVGIITEAQQANEIIANGKADAVLLARELLRDPYWPLHAAKILGVDLEWPAQYQRAKR